MKKNIKVYIDESGHSIVVIPEIIFRNKQNIDWNAVETYIRKYVGKIVVVAETKDVIYIGKDFPNEYKGSKYTKSLKGARAKVKANAVQGIVEMIAFARDKRVRMNYKEKHAKDARNGWYYYIVRFAMPVYQEQRKTEEYNVYSGCILVNHAKNGRKYLYDLVDIKKETSTPLKITL